jgi:hypothetical protein
MPTMKVGAAVSAQPEKLAGLTDDRDRVLSARVACALDGHGHLHGGGHARPGSVASFGVERRGNSYDID